MAIAVARRAARRRSPAARLPASITSLAGAGSKPVNDAAPLAGSENVVQDVRTIPSFAGKTIAISASWQCFRVWLGILVPQPEKLLFLNKYLTNRWQVA